MKRLCLGLCVLLFALGCSSDGDKGKWDDFWKDVRGDNMQMRGAFSGMKDMDDRSPQTKAHD